MEQALNTVKHLSPITETQGIKFVLVIPVRIQRDRSWELRKWSLMVKHPLHPSPMKRLQVENLDIELGA